FTRWAAAIRTYTPALHDALPISSVSSTTRSLGHLRPGLNPATCSTASDAATARAKVASGATGAGGRSRIVQSSEAPGGAVQVRRSEEHTSELQSRENLVCRLPLE